MVVEDLSVRRDRSQVLRGLSFELGRGEVVGLLGPSGCGKTTLMRALVGVQRGVSGTVTVLGEPAGSPAPVHRQARRRPQDIRLLRVAPETAERETEDGE